MNGRMWLTHHWCERIVNYLYSVEDRINDSVWVIMKRAEESRSHYPGCVKCTKRTHSFSVIQCLHKLCVNILCPPVRCWLWPVMSGFLWTPPWGLCLRSATFALLRLLLCPEQVLLTFPSFFMLLFVFSFCLGNFHNIGDFFFNSNVLGAARLIDTFLLTWTKCEMCHS